MIISEKLRPIHRITEESFEKMPSGFYGFPLYYTVTQEGIKIWTKPGNADINLYWGLHDNQQ